MRLHYENIYKLNFKYSCADISDFMYECIDYQKVDLMWIAEDMFYGFAELMDTIRFVRDNFDMTILLIEHDMKLVSGICENLTVLHSPSSFVNEYL